MEKKTVFYQEGNTVRTREVLVPTREEEVLSLPEREERQATRPVRQTAPRFNWARAGLVVLLTSLTVLFGFLGFTFLSLNASITASRSNIYRLENRLAELKAENLLAEDRLDAQVDLADVYRIATEQLGMIYPDENEQITYSEQLREYVRQYEDIPRN